MAKVKQTEIDEKYLWVGGGIILIILVIFVLGRVSGKQDSDVPSDANPNIKPITVSTNSGNVDWNPSALVKQIHTAYKVNWLYGRAEAIKQLSLLQDVQLIATADGYRQVYGETLRKVLTDVWVTGNDNLHANVINRMDVLQIP